MGLVADVFKGIIQKKDGSVIGKTLLQDGNIEISVSENDVRAGQGNGLVAVIHADTDINLSFTDIEWNLKQVAMHLGQTVKTGAKTGWAMPKQYQVTNDGTNDLITLDETPISETGLVIHDKDGKPLTDTNYMLSGSEVTFSGGVTEGDYVTVMTYKFNTDVATEEVEIDIAKFPEDVVVVLETLEIDNDERPIAKLQYQFDRVKPSASFSINTASERNASTQESTYRVMKPEHTTVVGRVIRIPLTA